MESNAASIPPATRPAIVRPSSLGRSRRRAWRSSSARWSVPPREGRKCPGSEEPPDLVEDPRRQQRLPFLVGAGERQGEALARRVYEAKEPAHFATVGTPRGVLVAFPIQRGAGGKRALGHA